MAVLIISFVILKKDLETALTGIILSVSSITFFVSTILQGGLMGISRNLLLHQCAFDIMLILVVMYAINIALSKRQELRDKYGVNQ